MASSIHNLDDSLVEYFDFTVKGHTYRFRHLNTEEMEKLRSFKDNDAEAQKYLYSFITKINEEDPEFPEIAKQMITPQWVKFRKMIETEFGG